DGEPVLETIVAMEAAAIIRLLQSLSGSLHVTFEETTQAAWLYEVIRHFVAEVVVCDPRRNKLLGQGSKADKPDARKLAELPRAGLLRVVYHGLIGDAKIEGTGARLRNAIGRHAADDASDQSDLSSTWNPDTRPCRVS